MNTRGLMNKFEGTYEQLWEEGVETVTLDESVLFRGDLDALFCLIEAGFLARSPDLVKEDSEEEDCVRLTHEQLSVLSDECSARGIHLGVDYLQNTKGRIVRGILTVQGDWGEIIGILWRGVVTEPRRAIEDGEALCEPLV